MSTVCHCAIMSLSCGKMKILSVAAVDTGNVK